MSAQRRLEIAQDIFTDVDRHELGLDVKDREDFVTSGEGNGQPYRSRWLFFALSYQRAFEGLWDASTAGLPMPLDRYPLLFVCRQSTELWLKAAISAIRQANPPPGHKLSTLWSELKRALSEDIDRGDWTGGAYPDFVEDVIQILDAHDEKGDRFRYPTDSRGGAYLSTEVDWDELYRAHELITGFCDSVITQVEVEQDFQVCGP